MNEQSNVTTFPKAKKARRPRGPLSDADLVKAIHKAQRVLARAIDDATAAGLSVRMHLDAQDKVCGRMRCLDAEVTRTYK